MDAWKARSPSPVDVKAVKAFIEDELGGWGARLVQPHAYKESQRSWRSLLGCRSWSFDLRYLLGQPPWDTEVTPPEVVELIEGESPPLGRALDLGCGTGTNCIYLARHGWEVVGVDFSILAIRRARRKARQARVGCRFYRGDVTDLVFLADPFDLALDIGCLHSLPIEGWERYSAEVARLVQPGGLYLLYAFTPRPGHSVTRGVAPEEVRSMFAPAFAVEREEGGEDPTGPRSAWYWLRRLGSAPD